MTHQDAPSQASDVGEAEKLRRDNRDLQSRLEDSVTREAELEAHGAVLEDQVEQLDHALDSSRTIGAAVGIVMAERQVDDKEGFAILSKASQDTNRKLSLIADEVVARRSADFLE